MKKFITLGILTMMITGIAAQNPVPYPKTINVSGTAELEIIPDEIYVIVTLREYEKKNSGKKDLETVKIAFLNACRSIGLPDTAVTIASYEGFVPQSWLQRKKSKDELFATIAYQIKFSSSKKIDELVNKLDDDATQNFQVSHVSHSKIHEYRKQVKIQAIKAAKEKARYLTEAIDEKIGEAVTINEINEGTIIPYNVLSNTISQYRQDAANFEKTEMGADFKKIRLKMEIQAVFALK